MKALLPSHFNRDHLNQLQSQFPDLGLARLDIQRSRPLVRRLLDALAKRVLSYSTYQRCRHWLEFSRTDYRVDGQPLGDSLPGIDILVAGWQFDRQAVNVLVDKLPDLKWVHSTVTGVNHIDPGQLQARDIRLSAPKSVHARRIAEFVMGLIYTEAKNILAHAEAAQQKRSRFLASREMGSLTLGILGYGAIGQAVARLGLANGMKVSACVRDPARVQHLAGVHLSIDMDSFLAETDVLCMALPLTAETNGIIGADQLSRLKQGAILINVGRGQTLVEKDLITALQQGQLRRAFIDVVDDPLTGRPLFVLPPNHPLFSASGAIFTGYSSSESVNSDTELMDDFIRNLVCYRAQEKLAGQVDLRLGY